LAKILARIHSDMFRRNKYCVRDKYYEMSLGFWW
jgi:hypothetical protein